MRLYFFTYILFSLFIMSCGKCGNSKIAAIKSSGIVTTLAGTAGSSGTNDGIGLAAKFFNPMGLAFDSGNIFVVDSSNHTIRKIVVATAEVTTVAGVPSITGSNDGGVTVSKFDHPEGITLLGTNLYITDTLNYTIRKMTLGTLNVTTLAGFAKSTGSSDGLLANARFLGPAGITNDGTNLFVADADNSTIRKIDLLAGTVDTIAGRANTPGDLDGAGINARFQHPYGIACDGLNLYVSDSVKHTIRKISIGFNWNVTTLAGSSGNSGSSDGVGLSARFNTPKELMTDGTSLYVADSGNHTIRKIDIASKTVTTLAGSAGLSGVGDGTGAAARFSMPTGITSDGTSLYVSDAAGHSIREIK